jgi:hypothetical protein
VPLNRIDEFSSYVLCGHVFGERAWEAPNRRRSDAVGAGDIDQAFTLGEPFHSFLPLVLVELPRAAKPHATGFRALPAVICAGFNQVPLESGEAGQDCDQKFTLRRGGITPRIVQRLELGALLGELVQDVQEITGRPCQPIKPCHDQHVGSLDPPHELAKLDAVGTGAADFLLVDLGAAGRAAPGGRT